MKKLKKLLLINWHFFSHEVVELEIINFLTGRNAAGKSTIIDALQMLMLGDANGRNFFNKAANEKSSRSVKGYLRCEMGDDGETGFRYLREGRFSSYVACEIYDEQKKSSFTLGVVFDCYADGSDEHRFFCLSAPIPENHFIVDNTPLSYKELRAFLNKNYDKGKQDFPDSDRRFQDVLKGRLGGLKNKYFNLFKKAVSFTPITNIETFITEYVCDIKNPVDIGIMQENIRAYKRLEMDADIMMKRIEVLVDIEKQYGEVLSTEQRLMMQRYIIERAELEKIVDKLGELRGKMESLEVQFKQLATQVTLCEESQVLANKDISRMNQEYYSSDLQRKLDLLKKEKEELDAEIQVISETCKKAVQSLRTYGLEWKRIAENCLEGNFSQEETTELMLAAKEVLPHSKILLNGNEATMAQLSLKEFSDSTECAQAFKTSAGKLSYRIGELKDSCEKDLLEQRVSLEKLRRGIKNYDRQLVSLKNEIEKSLQEKYKKQITVHIFAELLELADMRWHNAAEGYLHTQKFRLLVGPEYFLDALRIYDKLKNQMGFYGFGLVDLGRLADKHPKALQGSLAEEIITENHMARLYTDFLLGQLMKCERVEELRNHKKSITDSGMLYQNFVAEQMNPKRWENPFIGRRAIEMQINNTVRRIEEGEVQLEGCKNDLKRISGAIGLPIFTFTEAEGYRKTLDSYIHLPSLRQKEKSITEEIQGLDLTWLNKLEHKIKSREEESEKLRLHRIDLAEEETLVKSDLKRMNEELIPEAERDEINQQKQIDENFDFQWIQEFGQPRFDKVKEKRPSVHEIIDNYGRALEASRNSLELKKKNLESRRSKYNTEYKMSYDFQSVKNEEYDGELSLLEKSKLPEYRQKIEDAKNKSYQQFSDDFIAKLKGNIDTVKEQIKELNEALGDSVWNYEQYKFTWVPRQEYKKYYDMIVDSMLMEGYSLASQAFQEKHGDAIDELFKNITDVGSNMTADARAELEKNVKRFTDYRTYLSFDLVVKDSFGGEQRLSKTMQKKSGGETQTPFYIAVLASFAQLYRIKDTSFNRISLIVFDEAFSKMDSERIRESIKLLRKFGFQCILSAPPDKIGDIAPLVDRNLCVIREKTSAIVRSFDPKSLEDADL